MPKYEVEIEQEIILRTVRTERVKATINAEDEEDLHDVVDGLMDEDEICGWRLVNEEEEEDDFNFEILSVVEIPERFQECPGQTHLFD